MNEESPVFELRVSSEGQRWRVQLQGELDMAQTSILADAAEALRDCRLSTVDLDLGCVTFIDSAGYRAVLDASEIITEGGADVHIFNESGAVRRLQHLWELSAA